MTSREIVKRAVEFRSPPRLPLFFVNALPERSDVLRISYAPAESFLLRNTNYSEWGFRWERKDDTMGSPVEPPIDTWEKFDNYIPPDPFAKGRFSHLNAFFEKYGDLYYVADMQISGFSLACFLRGTENLLEDFYLEPEKLCKLLDMVVEFENGIIRQFASLPEGNLRSLPLARRHMPISAIGFADDFGTQENLIISPAMWREFIKPRLKKQFELVHSLGMHVYFHCCGYIYDIIRDLIDIGADILNLNQPDLLGIEKLARDFGGKVCFNCPVDHQTVAVRGTAAEIRDYVERLYRNFNFSNGGYIGHIEEYSCTGMSTENFEAIVNSFEEVSKRSMERRIEK